MKAGDFKHYSCPKCGCISIYSDWNTATIDYFNGGICDIEEPDRDLSDYVCPKCREIVSGADVIDTYMSL